VNAIYCFNLMTDWKVLDEALAINPAVPMEMLSLDLEEATYELKEFERALILCFVSGDADLRALTKFKEVFKKEFNNLYKFVPVLLKTNSLFETKLRKLGYTDWLDHNITSKSLRHKLDRWLVLINTKSHTPETKEKEALLSWVEATDNFDDFWVLKESDCKKILQNISLKLFGPGPAVSRWVDVEKNVWKFEIKEGERDEFLPLGGAWYFSGDQKPDFVWSSNTWLFVGSSPKLFYKNEAEGSEDFKFKTENGKVISRKNSMPALNRQKKIMETFDQSLTFKKDASIVTKGHVDASATTQGKDLQATLDQHLEGSLLEMELDQTESESPVLEAALNAPGAGAMLMYDQVEEVISSEERSSFLKLSASPVESWVVKCSDEKAEVQFLDLDEESIYVRGNLKSHDAAELSVKGTYYTVKLNLQVKGSLVATEVGGDVFRLLLENKQLPSLLKIKSFYEMRKRIMYSLLKAGRV
jgi:hypothetical protein